MFSTDPNRSLTRSRARPIPYAERMNSAPAQPGQTLLEVEGLQKSFGKRMVVKGVSFRVAAGEIVGLLGPNGAGKTTSFRMTAGVIKPGAVVVLLGGKECSPLPMYQRARLGMGYLPQGVLAP